MSDEVKACPFCGEAAAWTVAKYSIVGCVNPTCFGYLIQTSNLAYWNTRPLESALTSKCAALEAKYDRVDPVIDAAKTYAVFAVVNETAGDERTERARIALLNAVEAWLWRPPSAQSRAPAKAKEQENE